MYIQKMGKLTMFFYLFPCYQMCHVLVLLHPLVLLRQTKQSTLGATSKKTTFLADMSVKEGGGPLSSKNIFAVRDKQLKASFSVLKELVFVHEEKRKFALMSVNP